MRLIILLGVLALGAVPAALAEDTPPPSQQASALCKQQRTAIGATLFSQLYGGGHNAYGRCVSKLSRAASADAANASKQCAAERTDAGFAAAHDGKSFADFYGAGKNGRNAFGKCVSKKSEELTQEEQADTLAAAKTCKAERTKLGAAAFAEKYGNRANAFGKCVAKVAHAQP